MSRGPSTEGDHGPQIQGGIAVRLLASGVAITAGIAALVIAILLVRGVLT